MIAADLRLCPGEPGHVPADGGSLPRVSHGASIDNILWMREPQVHRKFLAPTATELTRWLNEATQLVTLMHGTFRAKGNIKGVTNRSASPPPPRVGAGCE